MAPKGFIIIPCINILFASIIRNHISLVISLIDAGTAFWLIVGCPSCYFRDIIKPPFLGMVVGHRVKCPSVWYILLFSLFAGYMIYRHFYHHGFVNAIVYIFSP